MKACVEAPVCEGLRLNIVHDRRRWDVQQLVVWTHIHAQRVRRTQEKIGEREEEINVEEGEDQTEKGREDDDNGPGQPGPFFLGVIGSYALRRAFFSAAADSSFASGQFTVAN